jgi:hypothetical protein
MPHWVITRCPYNSPEAKVNDKFLVFTGTANPSLADGIARELGVQIGTCTVDKYSDGDVAVQLLESLRRKKVFLMQPTSPSARNSHRGDARATEMGQRGALNVGQLTREKYGSDAVLVGFTTHHGAVTAASDWGGLAKPKVVRPALAESYEAILHTSLSAYFLLILRAGCPISSMSCCMSTRRGQSSRSKSSRNGKS